MFTNVRNNIQYVVAAIVRVNVWSSWLSMLWSSSLSAPYFIYVLSITSLQFGTVHTSSPTAAIYFAVLLIYLTIVIMCSSLKFSIIEFLLSLHRYPTRAKFSRALSVNDIELQIYYMMLITCVLLLPPIIQWRIVLMRSKQNEEARFTCIYNWLQIGMCL